MPVKSAEEIVKADDERRSYELGCLLMPTAPAGEIAGLVEREIVQVIVAAAGEVLECSLPRMIRLAYPVKKTIDHKSRQFAEAYFGFLRFRGLPSSVAAVGEKIRQSEWVIRHLITSRQAPVAAPAGRIFSDRPTVKNERGLSRSSEAIDREIEGMLTLTPVK